MTKVSIGSPVLEGDALDDSRDVLAHVGGLLEQLVHIAPLDHFQCIHAALEQVGQGLARDLVGLVLQAIDLDAVGPYRVPVHLGKLLDEVAHLARLGFEKLGHGLDGRGDGSDAVQIEMVDRGFH